jgi:hypothetical protein
VDIYYNVFYNRGGGHYNGWNFDRNAPNAGEHIRIYNNTFDLEATVNDGFNQVVRYQEPLGTIEMKNNAIIYSNASEVDTGTHTNNAFDNTSPFVVYNIPTETNRVVAVDLGFVNVTTGPSNPADYHLRASSPLIGRGVNVGLTQDFDGNPVPATPSIGAFEAGSSSIVLLPPTNLRVIP